MSPFIAQEGHSLDTSRRTARVVWLITLFLALFAGRTAFAASLSEASAIRDECAEAKAAIENAYSLAVSPNTAFWTALHDGEAHVDEARRIAAAATWPAELSAQRTSVL